MCVSVFVCLFVCYMCVCVCVCVCLFLQKSKRSMPVDGHPDSFILDYLLAESKYNDSVVQNGNVYIAYDHHSKLQDVLTSLGEYFRATPNIFVCMAGITHRPLLQVIEDEDSDKLKQDIVSIGRLVLVTSNWKDIDAKLMKQPTVLYEVFCALINKDTCKFDLALNFNECSALKEKDGIKKDIIDRQVQAEKRAAHDWKSLTQESICRCLLDKLS